MGRSRDLADGTLAELNVDSNTLAVDATNDRVGIGTSSPSNKLHVSGSGNSTPAYFYTPSGQCAIRVETAGNDKAVTEYYTGGNGNWRIGPGITTAGAFEFNSVTAGATRMLIDSSGRVTMPYQPMAVARLSSDVQGSSDLLLFDTTDINIGSHYNTSLKRFTAPVAGRYYIAVEVQFHSGATQIYTGIKVNKNGGQVCDAYTNQYASNAHARITVNRVFELSANDYLEVRVAGSAGTYPTVQGGGSNRTAFTCFLLS